MLWGSGSLFERCRAVITLTIMHGRNLAAYAVLYKCVFNALAATGFGSRLQWTAGPLPLPEGASGAAQRHAPLRAAIAGAIGGYVVFNKDTTVNQQIILYLFSRACIGAAKTWTARRSEPCKGGTSPCRGRAFCHPRPWPLFAAACWAATMALWEFDKQHLQTGLVRSMDFIYSDGHVGDSASWGALFPTWVNTLTGKIGCLNAPLTL